MNHKRLISNSKIVSCSKSTGALFSFIFLSLLVSCFGCDNVCTGSQPLPCLVISEIGGVLGDSQIIEIYNPQDYDIDTSGWYFYNKPNSEPLGDGTITAFQNKVFAVSLTFNEENDEIALFNSNQFTEKDAMVDFVCWGDVTKFIQTSKFLAESAGLWVLGGNCYEGGSPFQGSLLSLQRLANTLGTQESDYVLSDPSGGVCIVPTAPIPPFNPPTVAPPPPTVAPTTQPTVAPTMAPTMAPTIAPTTQPTDAPTAPPTDAPTAPPMDIPTAPPTDVPTAPPTDAPTAPPMDMPTAPPMDSPTAPVEPPMVPTDPPTSAPTAAPPTDSPLAPPADVPTDAPSFINPTDAAPTQAPSSPTPTSAPNEGTRLKWNIILCLSLIVLFFF